MMIRRKNTLCHLCMRPKVWMMSYYWHMKHAEKWGHGCRIWITSNEVERGAQSSRSGRKEDLTSYLYDLQKRLDIDPNPMKPWKGPRTRFYQMWVPGIEEEKDREAERKKVKKDSLQD